MKPTHTAAAPPPRRIKRFRSQVCLGLFHVTPRSITIFLNGSLTKRSEARRVYIKRMELEETPASPTASSRWQTTLRLSNSWRLHREFLARIESRNCSKSGHKKHVEI